MTAAPLLVSLAVLVASSQTQPPPPAARAPACEAARAFRLVREQLSESKALENGSQRSGVLTRAADLLWPYEEAEARALFADAFEAASSHYKEHGPEQTERKHVRPDATGPGLRIGLGDPRVAVVHAVARRDPAWAQKLTARMAEETRRRAAEAETKARYEGEVSDKLLMMARGHADSNPSLALSVARESLRYPAGRYLPSFIYDLARADRAAADAFYADALRAYAGADASAFLLLSAYPFGFSRCIGLAPGYNSAGVPPQGFAPSVEFQRQFVAAFLRVAERRLAAAAGQPPPPDNPFPPSEVETVYTALWTLERVYGGADRGYAAAAAPLKLAAEALLSERTRRRAENGSQRTLIAEPPGGDPAGQLDRVLESAEKVKDPERRDQQLVMGLQTAYRGESVERLEAAAEKIKDEVTRRQLLDMIYFSKAVTGVRAGQLDEAVRLAEKVEAVEQRAVLAGEVVAAEPKRPADPAGATHAAALAESVYKSAQRAPESEEKARALLALSQVYARIDPLRAPAVLSEAIAAINRLPGFDATRSFATRAVEGKTFNFYTSHPAPGFNLAGVLKELAARDFEAALALTGALDDRYQRALAVLALASKCLEDAPGPEQPAAAPKRTPKPTPEAGKPGPAPKTQAPPKKRP
jgi:hypothetical protein